MNQPGGNLEAIIGTIVGALIAGVAMILNSHFSARRQEAREDHVARRKQLEGDVQELTDLYQKTLQIVDRLIRKFGRDSENKLESMYNIEVRLQLLATPEINDKLEEVKNLIAEMARELPSFPEEFIPKFEGDRDRFERLRLRDGTEKEREAEAKKYLPNIRKKRDDLSDAMKLDLERRKNLDS